ncbi:MAG: hypothetical protein A2219_06330 [Elusimicrobia bacterium RIFOXYA2_FULL_50_26]|nr:MAG: hypothetical protein A2219_06330 [Elusimicrobia bacterium RIFOXYA2_FULL_50_26]OGS24423.1 MAG: hypothetical protein A2314_09290 [Elusimicrobia bacterium RIFOXYB2_FULL_50_12]
MACFFVIIAFIAGMAAGDVAAETNIRKAGILLPGTTVAPPPSGFGVQSTTSAFPSPFLPPASTQQFFSPPSRGFYSAPFTPGTTGNLFALPDSGIPTVRITNPASGSSFSAPSNIMISVDVSQAASDIAKVEFIADGSILIGSATAPPYSVSWNNVPDGEHTIIARITDANGASSDSFPVTISILPAR